VADQTLHEYRPAEIWAYNTSYRRVLCGVLATTTVTTKAMPICSQKTLHTCSKRKVVAPLKPVP